jgi:hypothetical protein
MEKNKAAIPERGSERSPDILACSSRENRVVLVKAGQAPSEKLADTLIGEGDGHVVDAVEGEDDGLVRLLGKDRPLDCGAGALASLTCCQGR